MNLGPKGGVEGNAVNIEVFASLTINFKEMHITMNECANVVKIGYVLNIKQRKFNNNIYFVVKYQ